MTRLFAALELPPAVTRSLDKPRGGVEDARWQRDDQLHLTLAFFGELDRRRREDLMVHLSDIWLDPFDLTLKGVDQFGKDGRVKTLWAGVENPAPITLLHEKISHLAIRLGIDLDNRRFKPHVTLARFKRRASPPIGSWLHDNENLICPRFEVTHFTLFSSHRTDTGSYYQAEARYGSPPSWLEPDWISTTADDFIEQDASGDWNNPLVDDLRSQRLV